MQHRLQGSAGRLNETMRIPENNQAFVGDWDVITALREYALEHRCRENETLFRQGEIPESLFVLQEGQVTLKSGEADRERIFVRQTLPGSIFGLPGVIGNTPYSLTAVAEAGTQLQVITREAFHRLLITHPEVSFHALRILAAEVQAARRLLQQSARPSGAVCRESSGKRKQQ